MITLFILCTIGSIFGWIVRFIQSKQGRYNFNIFESDATIISFSLLASTVYSFSYLLFLIIKYLP